MKSVNRWKRSKEDLLFLLKLNRPVGIPLISLVILGGAVSQGVMTAELAVKTVLLSTLIGYVGFAPNDYVDRKTDRENPRKGGWQGTKASGRKSILAKYISIVTVAVSLFTSTVLPFTAGASMFGITVIALLYSVPPARLKSVPILDSLSNAAMAYLAFCLGVGLAGESFGSVIPGAFWFSLVFAGGGHAIGSLLDLEPDREAGISTIGTFLGWKKTIAVIQSLIAAALFFEKWSMESRTFLVVTFLGLLAPAYRNRKETLQKSIYTGLAVYVVYGVIWLWLRM